ncbi:MATA-HMG [Gigaspora margarita]|uniref:MATA-HMG n=1 Tax=Gigaspora margarita TaxID=4874 RepID=A0A8H4ERT4_GIGMA|nr:MATA-HMG [Gigaspora margarita]
MPKVNSNNSTRVKRRQSICTSTPPFRPSPDDKTTAEILAGLTAEHIPFPDTHFIKRVLENSRRAKSKKNDPPRPPNAFFLFRNALHIHLSTHNLKVPQVSMAAGKLWDNATEKTKSQYTRLQEIAKVLHLEMHPGYVYRPRKSLQDKKEDDQRQHQINKNSLMSVQYSQDIQDIQDINVSHPSSSSSTLSSSSSSSIVNSMHLPQLSPSQSSTSSLASSTPSSPIKSSSRLSNLEEQNLPSIIGYNNPTIEQHNLHNQYNHHHNHHNHHNHHHIPTQIHHHHQLPNLHQFQPTNVIHNNLSNRSSVPSFTRHIPNISYARSTQRQSPVHIPINNHHHQLHHLRSQIQSQPQLFTNNLSHQRKLQQRQLQQQQQQQPQQCISNSNAIGQPSIFNNTSQIIDPALITTSAPTLTPSPNFNLFNEFSNGNNGYISGLRFQDMSNLMSFGLCEQDDGSFNEWINWDIKL